MTLLAAAACKRFRAAASFSGGPYWPPFTDARDLPFDRKDPREIRLRSPIAYAGSFKCPLRLYYGADEAEALGLMSRRTAALARRRGLNVEAVETEGNHGTHVYRSMMRSIAFFQRVSAQDLPAWHGQVTPLPRRLELDLGAGVTMKLVRIERGKFRMGSPPTEAGRGDDEARHEVEISKPYCMGVYPVTQAQYRQVTGTSPSRFSPRGEGVFRDRVSGLDTDDFPVENVSWEDATDFCRVVSLRPGVRDKGWVVDLPTEAEWEYACRAGTETAFHYGDALSSRQANFNGEYPYGGAPKGPFLGRTTRVGSYPANAWGLHDMHGNVAQLCKDRYDKNYQHGRGKGDTSDRVARGGYWLLPAKACRSACREHSAEPWRRSAGLGFRVVVRLREKTRDAGPSR
jgi:formylglycine-generating enzyme required for sulfatase activity